MTVIYTNQVPVQFPGASESFGYGITIKYTSDTRTWGKMWAEPLKVRKYLNVVRRNGCFTVTFSGSACAHPRAKFALCFPHNSFASLHIQFNLIKPDPTEIIKLNAYLNETS